ncbi:hypothetical protein VP01_8072g1 [Puccinia sorghi]|uniref:Uncharacterized protein n=1 Tax=Puccinia sorghi TaxID=27349 RepID=A0A0L6UCG6_9BASI|nr:hypothetical protein VP01_8072g1 [Puccinia sorghi]
MNPTVMPCSPIQNYTPSGGTPSVEWNNNPDGNLFNGTGWLCECHQARNQPPQTQPLASPPITILRGRKQKAQPSTPSEDSSKYIKVEGKENTVITWKTDNHELANFKSKAILAILGVEE